MKIIKVVFSVAITFFVTVAGAQALTVKLTDPYASPSYNGGPFRATVLDPAPYNLPYGVFDTFCLEYNEVFSLGATLYGSIGNAAIAGGAGGAIPDPGNPGRTYDPLDIKTQKLYNYYLDNQAALTLDQRAAMQLAIWRVEQEVDSTYGGLLNTTIRGLADVFFNNADSYTLNREIQVLNLYGDASLSYESRKQSQLIQTPEPTTMIFLGSGILGLALYSRLRRKK